MPQDILRHAKILIVDDSDANIRLLERILHQAGYTHYQSTTDPRTVLTLYREFHPDLILLDLMMPHLDGLAVMEQLALEMLDGAYFPILVLTSDITLEAQRRALAAGAKDFVTKPFDPTEVLLRIGNLLETRYLHMQLHDQNKTLEQRVRERTQQLEELHLELLERLAVAAEYRDDATGQHTRRTGHTAGRLAQVLRLPKRLVELIRRASPLHDVGKIGIPDHILLKPGQLTPAEFEVMKTHTTIGARILSGGRFPLLQTAEKIAFTHHERWDGNGYPRGLKGEAIPLEGRIVAVCDAFDALTRDRPYKPAVSVDDALGELQRCAGTQFDPRVVNAFQVILLPHDSRRAALG